MRKSPLKREHFVRTASESIPRADPLTLNISYSAIKGRALTPMVFHPSEGSHFEALMAGKKGVQITWDSHLHWHLEGFMVRTKGVRKKLHHSKIQNKTVKAIM